MKGEAALGTTSERLAERLQDGSTLRAARDAVSPGHLQGAWSEGVVSLSGPFGGRRSFSLLALLTAVLVAVLPVFSRKGLS
jgi:hypothetical protein